MAMFVSNKEKKWREINLQLISISVIVENKNEQKSILMNNLVE